MNSVGLLIMGPLSDKYGRKPFLLLSLFGSCFGKRIHFHFMDRLYFPGHVNDHVDFYYLEIIHRFVRWFSHSCSSVLFIKYLIM